MTIRRLRCAVVTCFSAEQPGFLDFSYRVEALSKAHDVTLVSNLLLDIPEFCLPAIKKVQIAMPPGQIGWLIYLWRVSRWLKSSGRWDIVVLLHSATAPLAVPFKRAPTLVYWNEHPTHLAASPAKFDPVRTPFRAFIRGLMFAGARMSNLVMPIGEAHRDDLLANGCKPHRVRLMYMGASANFRTSAPSTQPCPPPIRLVYAGSISKERGRDVMLEAMALINPPGSLPVATLKLIGASQSELDYCKTRIAKLGIADSVEILGRIPGDQIPRHIHQADMGICLWEDKPWYHFNPPTKLFEYLVAGLPVLASNIRTHTSYITHNKNGFIFEYSASGLAESIREAICKIDQLPAMKQSAWSEGERYLWKQIEPHFMNAVDQVTRA